MNSLTLWQEVKAEVEKALTQELLLKTFFQNCVLQQSSLGNSLAFILASKLQNAVLPQSALLPLFQKIFSQPEIEEILSHDMKAAYERDSACHHYYQALCFYKGFHALSAYRIAHALWQNKETTLAYLLQNRISVALQVDIHPAAQIGHGVMLDHATGIVIGETATVGNNVSIMQSVTLGGTGKESGNRHPNIHDGVLISVGAKILGNIDIGEGAQIAAGSVVLKPVKPHTTVAGVPAKPVGTPCSKQPALSMNHKI